MILPLHWRDSDDGSWRIEVRARQIVGLAGLLGSGRTEVARAIFGADPPDAGTIRLAGKAFSPREPADAIALGVGYCSEDRKADGIVPDMSVRENITLGILPRLTRMGIVDEARQRALSALEDVLTRHTIFHRAEAFVGQLDDLNRGRG